MVLLLHDYNYYHEPYTSPIFLILCVGNTYLPLFFITEIITVEIEFENK